jgi:hypothetical protein
VGRLGVLVGGISSVAAGAVADSKMPCDAGVPDSEAGGFEEGPAGLLQDAETRISKLSAKMIVRMGDSLDTKAAHVRCQQPTAI